MKAAQTQAEQPAEMVWGSLNIFGFMPSLPGPAFRVLAHLVGYQEPGGRIVTTQGEIADILGVDRSLVTVAFQHLGFARMVRRQRHGVYQLNPMLAGYRTPVEALNAIRAMPEEDRLDQPDFQERYERAAQQYQEEKLRKKQRRQTQAPVADLTARRRKLQAVEDRPDV